MDTLVDDGFVVLGGPVGEDPHHADDVVLIVSAQDTDTTRERLAPDPWLQNSTLAIKSIEPWTVWLKPS
jgi:hypothetical protein